MALPPSPSNNEHSKSSLTYSLLRLVLACAMGIFISQLKLDAWESTLYDLRVRLLPKPQPSGHIEMIVTTSQTVESLKGVPNAREQAELLHQLRSENPLAVLFTQDMTELQGSDEDKKLFAAEAQHFKNLYVVSQDLEMKGEEGKLRLKGALEPIELTPGPRTWDKSVLAQDEVTRRMMIAYQDRLMIQPQIAALINPEIANKNNIRGLFQFFDADQAYIKYRNPYTYPQISFEQALKGDFPRGRFTNKVVLLGNDHGGSIKDYIKTPFSKDAKSMTIVEMNANIIDTLIQNSAPIQVPAWINFLITIAISILTVHVLFTLKPSKSLTVLLMAGAALILIGGVAFHPFGYWVRMAHPFLAIFLCYYFFIPYRLIIENRRSWEYYQKNKLLSQVEELKTNFISMMSHDLKTPLARIQGMTDVILKDTQPLTSQQREAVDTIRQSSEDLLKFISAILNYGKIESEGVELHLQSRDVNALLKDVIRKHEFLAKVKRIRILFEAEPLFAIQVDPELIKQVLSNLVENAIKYSPEESQVRVTSAEVDGKVIIRVYDEGPGIPDDEVANIFMKFFRSKNAKSSPIKGSGLGLYLAKYFTELHQGKISVESTYGKGSTFTVELPLEQTVENSGKNATARRSDEKGSPMLKVLVVDDDQGLRLAVKTALVSSNRFEVEEAFDGQNAIEKIRATEATAGKKFDVVILDVDMPRVNGLEALRLIKENDPGMIVLMLTAHATVDHAVQAVKDGAYNYLSKPVSADELLNLVDKAVSAHTMISNIAASAPVLVEAGRKIIGNTQQMQKVFNIIHRLAKVDTPVLIRGASGAGKELVAKAIHYNSARKDEKFVAINCSAIPENLFESELFGHEKGSFTGADQRKIGRFQYAEGGTLFLDEVGDMPLMMQVKILRVLQEKAFTPVGSNREISTNVRIVAATNRPLEEMIKLGTFREDLFYRLNVVPIFLPPLADRKDDVENLVNIFIKKFNQAHNKRISGVSADAMSCLKKYQWPGNIRELENVIEHAFVLESGNVITLASLPETVLAAAGVNLIELDASASASAASNSGDSKQIQKAAFDEDEDSASALGLDGDLEGEEEAPVSYTGENLDFNAQKENFEKEFIIKALKTFKGRINQTALHANIPKKTLLRKIEKYGINAKDYFA